MQPETTSYVSHKTQSSSKLGSTNAGDRSPNSPYFDRRFKRNNNGMAS